MVPKSTSIKTKDILFTPIGAGSTVNQDNFRLNLKPWMPTTQLISGRSYSMETELWRYFNQTMVVVASRMDLKKASLHSAWKMLTWKHGKTCKLKRPILNIIKDWKIVPSLITTITSMLCKTRLGKSKIISTNFKKLHLMILFKLTNPPLSLSQELLSLVLLQDSSQEFLPLLS